MKTYVLYHANCPDGFGAAFAAWLSLQDEAEYIPVSYGKPMPEIEQRSRVYILDFSYSRQDLIDLEARTDQLLVLDHHATAENDLKGLPFCVFDMSKSGAVLACEYFHDSIKCEVDQLGEFFAYLQDRDLWQFKLPMSREVSMAVRSYPYDFKTWSDISGLTVSGQIYEAPGICIDRLKKEGIACRRLTEQQVENMANHHRWVRFDTTSVSDKLAFTDKCGIQNPEEGWLYAPVANATVFFSEVGEKLLEKHPEAMLSAYYMDRADGKRQWGLRSRNGFDCSVIAKAFGGGGHKQAAGFVEQL